MAEAADGARPGDAADDAGKGGERVSEIRSMIAEIDVPVQFGEGGFTCRLYERGRLRFPGIPEREAELVEICTDGETLSLQFAWEDPAVEVERLRAALCLLADQTQLYIDGPGDGHEGQEPLSALQGAIDKAMAIARGEVSANG